VTDSTPTKQRSSAAERMRLTRDRRRKGIRLIRFEVRDAEVENLIKLNVLDANARNDREAIAIALGILLDRIPVAWWHAAMSELSRRGRRIEARTVGNGCSPDGATMYDGAMSYRCIVSDTQRAARIAVQDTSILDVDPLTNNDRLVVASHH
jgi:hypothetical protein